MFSSFLLGQIHTKSPLIDLVMMQRLEKLELTKKVLQLPIKYREVMVLFYYEELTSAAIAELLNLSENTVKTRLRRSRNMLKERLDEEDGRFFVMNKIKGELYKLFNDESRFSETAENRVVDTVTTRKQKSSHRRLWQYPIVVFSFVVIMGLLIAVGLWQPHESKEEALVAWLEDQNSVEVIYTEMDVLQKDDAVVVYKVQQNERLFVHVAYLTYKERQWMHTDHCSNGFSAEDEVIRYLNSTQEPYIYCGAEKTNFLKQVIIVQEQAKMLKVENEGVFWFAFAESSMERVVFEYKDGTMQRMNSIEWNYAGFDDTVPIVGSLSGQQYELSYTSDTMERGNDEYQAYPVVIEPKVDELRNSDVVYIETEDGEQKLTRIVGLPGEKAAIRNGTVVVNTIPLDIFWLCFTRGLQRI